MRYFLVIGIMAFSLGLIVFAQYNCDDNVEKARQNSQFLDCLSFSNDGKKLTCSCSDGTIRIVDPITGEHTALKMRFVVLWTLSISSDVKTMAIADGNDIEILNNKDHAKLGSLSGHTGSIAWLVFPNEDTLFSGSTDGTVRYWDVKQKKLKKKLLDQAYEVLALACTSDVEYLAAGDAQGIITVWKKPFEDVSFRIPAHQGTVRSLAFSADNKKLVTTGGDNMARVWDLSSKKAEVTFKDHGGPVISLAISSDAKHVATGSSRDNALFVWNINTGAQVAKFKLPNHPRSLAFSPDGKMLVAGTWESALYFYRCDKWEQSKILKLN
jgi:WD40 repeat protein